MSIDPYIVLGSALVGFLVGMTGAGGGALMTPMLILFFSVKPSTAISSDLVAAVLMRPVGAAVHMTKKTVNYRLVDFERRRQTGSGQYLTEDEITKSGAYTVADAVKNMRGVLYECIYSSTT